MKTNLEQKENSSKESSKIKRRIPNLLNPITTVGRGVVKVGGAIARSTLRAGNTLTKQAVRLVSRGTQDVGRTITFFGKLPGLQRFASVLKLDWLVGATDQVDLAKAEAAVQELRQKYPDESSSQIAHRIMVQKAFQAGGIGLASSVLPGYAAALLAVDLAATTALQTEMIYQIAAAYDMDLSDPARKGEVLGIFGLALGGKNAVRAGLGFLRNIPLAGMMIGAGTNTVMLYSLGYAARRFYEAKLSSDAEEPAVQTLEAIQKDSEKFLDVAIAQQALVDQILVHMVLASYPQKRWEDIMPELRSLNIEDDSLKAIAHHIQSPEPLGALLQQLNCDFAVPLYAQCEKIAQQSASINSEESKILDAIREKCPQTTLTSLTKK